MKNQQDVMRQALGKTIASAWADPEFKSRLLSAPRSALRDMGLVPPPHLQILVVENTAQKVHITLPAPWADTSNPIFMQQMKKNPQATLAKAGIKVTKTADIVFLENTENIIHIIIPLTPDHEEISIEQL